MHLSAQLPPREMPNLRPRVTPGPIIVTWFTATTNLYLQRLALNRQVSMSSEDGGDVGGMLEGRRWRLRWSEERGCTRTNV